MEFASTLTQRALATNDAVCDCDDARYTTLTASISQDYWGDIKEDRESGERKSPSGVRGRAPVGSMSDEVPQKLKLFCELHIIFALKYNKQQLLSLSPTS